MKRQIARALKRDTLLTRAVAWWLDACDYKLGRLDEAMAFAYVCERVVLAGVGLWWIYGHAPLCLGDSLYGLWILPVVVIARHRQK